jgi:hypothetical protein
LSGFIALSTLLALSRATPPQQQYLLLQLRALRAMHHQLCLFLFISTSEAALT